jgi:hypothetical protein
MLVLVALLAFLAYLGFRVVTRGEGSGTVGAPAPVSAPR